ncbi:MAG: lysophospholipase, partial [Chloroflexi bacterium]|nr:lysophospholipase [Chloroflexota bacterium]
LSVNSVSARYILRIAQAIASVFLRKSLTISAPTLIIHGGKDRILSPLGSRLLNLRIKAPEKRLVILPEAYHTLLWDKSSSAEVLALMEDWILRLSSGL